MLYSGRTIFFLKSAQVSLGFIMTSPSTQLDISGYLIMKAVLEIKTVTIVPALGML